MTVTIQVDWLQTLNLKFQRQQQVKSVHQNRLNPPRSLVRSREQCWYTL